MDLPNRDYVLSLVKQLISGQRSALEVAAWAQQFYATDNRSILNKLVEDDPILEEFIGTLILVDAIDEEGRLLYGKSDYAIWVEEFENAIR